jgi:hypothetical protein
MSWLLRSAVAASAVELLCLADAGAAPTGRQSYSPKWTYNKTANYHYKTYYYKPRPTDTTYKQQIVVYKPTRTKNFVYWYNPDTKKYWARCPTVNHPTYGASVRRGEDYWSMLPNDRKAASLDSIREDYFGPIQKTSPPVPYSSDGAHIACPPTDLPPVPLPPG